MKKSYVIPKVNVVRLTDCRLLAGSIQDAGLPDATPPSLSDTDVE